MSIDIGVSLRRIFFPAAVAAWEIRFLLAGLDNKTDLTLVCCSIVIENLQKPCFTHNNESYIMQIIQCCHLGARAALN